VREEGGSSMNFKPVMGVDTAGQGYREMAG